MALIPRWRTASSAENSSDVSQSPILTPLSGGAVIDHPLPRTMQRLNILLFDALLQDKGNVGFDVRPYK